VPGVLRGTHNSCADKVGFVGSAALHDASPVFQRPLYQRF